MNMRAIPSRTAALIVAANLFAAGAAFGDEVRVITSGAFTAAYLELVPEFERATKNNVVTTFGGSMGNGPETIPNRLQRGEPADVVILAAAALDDLIKQGKVVAGSRVDLVRSSGVYLSTEMFQRLGIADQVLPKSKNAQGERVGVLVARGDAEIGFQQISELLPEPGIDYVGPLPPGAQRVTVFSAGIVVGAKKPEVARALIKFLASENAISVIKKTGLEPVTAAEPVTAP